jgi:hypothetical protein
MQREFTASCEYSLAFQMPPLQTRPGLTRFNAVVKAFV